MGSGFSETIPSSTAALVALIASSRRNLRSLISVSVAAPTLMTATPPASLAKRSCNFSEPIPLIVFEQSRYEW